MLCSLVEQYWSFRGRCYFHLRGEVYILRSWLSYISRLQRSWSLRSKEGSKEMELVPGQWELWVGHYFSSQVGNGTVRKEVSSAPLVFLAGGKFWHKVSPFRALVGSGRSWSWVEECCSRRSWLTCPQTEPSSPFPTVSNEWISEYKASNAQMSRMKHQYPPTRLHGSITWIIHEKLINQQFI
jgi:hypothetical protein